MKTLIVVLIVVLWCGAVSGQDRFVTNYYAFEELRGRLEVLEEKIDKICEKLDIDVSPKFTCCYDARCNNYLIDGKESGECGYYIALPGRDIVACTCGCKDKDEKEANK